MTLQIINCEQGQPEWYAARMGIPTASEFHTVMAKGEGKTRKAYMLKLAGEILTGEPMENYTNGNMERGKIMEDEARDLYSFIKDIEPERVGFIRNGNKGCSPDSLIGINSGLEIKTALPHIQIDRLMKDELPPEHKAQVQGSMWVAERETWDFVSYWPKLPLFIKPVARDNGYIANLAGEVDRFNDELQAVVERIRKYGAESLAA
ncbi:MAG: YqaJ viral recombinase family protein [Patescibacteria group bacterium]|nr:YqaJ viral recombinase family protein [Patescibacteria group bacterium]